MHAYREALSFDVRHQQLAADARIACPALRPWQCIKGRQEPGDADLRLSELEREAEKLAPPAAAKTRHPKSPHVRTRDGGGSSLTR